MSAPEEKVERECRQLRLMLDRVAGLRSGDLSIGHAIGDLEGLLYQLELASDGWRDEFTEAWSLLEIAYAVALDRNEPLPTASDGDVAEGLAAIERLAGARLAELDA